ncbi:hypothetical protein MMC15_005201 [Xylographa vitiligo]|nr:hypothetical protein [Xylographa vitiligo]
MPTKARKKPVARCNYETIDRPKQTYFTPQARIVLNRNPSLSAPTSRQQTLTQIDFVCRLPVEDVDMDSEYMSEEVPVARKRRRAMPASADQDGDASYEEPVPKKRKRRQTAPATNEDSNEMNHFTNEPSPVHPKRKPVSKTVLAPKLKTTPSKGTAQKVAKKSTKSVQGKSYEAVGIYEELPNSPQAQSRRSSENMMPPPRTPRTVVKTEIPSSQSPGNTPLSMHSRRSVRNNSRSPLKEKSSNRCMTKSSKADGGKSVRWTPRLEIRDTFEGEPLSPVQKKIITRVPKLVIRDTFEPGSEGSESSTVTQSSKGDTISQKRRTTLGSDIPMSDMPLASIPSESPQPRPSSSRDTSTPTLETIQPNQSIGSEIQETDDEHHDGQHDENDFDIGLDTQAALHNAQTLPSDASSEHERIPSIIEDFNNAMRVAAKGFSAVPLQPTRTIPSYGITTDHHPRTAKNITTPRTPSSNRQANDDSPPTTTQVPRTPPSRLSSSDQASAQLTSELLRQTPQPTITLPSKAPLSKSNPQPSSTPILIEDDDDDDDKNPLPIKHSTRALATTPTPSSSSAARPPPLPSHRAPVPFSQATTVDVTQSSPRPSYTQVPSSPQPRTSLPDKPPRAGMETVPTVISSSPLQDSAAERSSPEQPRLWDGRPLTDSQLLPDSLMDMSVPRPPWGLSQESWTEE